MKISLLQMDMKPELVRENFLLAERFIHDAMRSSPDVLVLPETWNTGFFPREELANLACNDGDEVRAKIGALAAEYAVNIVAGSVSNRRGDKVYNTAFVFDRKGDCIAEYDKTHLFSPMGEDKYYQSGENVCTFLLDGVKCAVIICYDLRFPEFFRRIALQNAEIMFVVAQWPLIRISHLQMLAKARAIENQMFVAYCNSCGRMGETIFGGNSAIVSPLGEVLASAGDGEGITTADCDAGMLSRLREEIPVFRDRRPEIY